ncbi:flagellar hook-basal body complex protein [Acetobacter oeni]|uniref:Flagellar hook protein FlgE n=1 Tax=Acetobacter oeni TaxID=304077 RepID=A0A511XFT5_9PROT|nr:flagellar hook-basal body complex protein [Acetobacter oeni]MBB3882264.1 flagellar hook protein FlgE [Acetobacter oeni]NHO18017.1 flagellar hook-basal body complex protein [Acetobacter oeni]GBR01172.1 flagellar hook protein FlgE [Acetobacter oeni LMG 21952]GEN61816.1 flagellar hook protein FlgE [Acetobacter oeni]
MSIFNALNTAVQGINAQSTAFTNLSNNIANSQTVGYKASETSFQDFVSDSLSTSQAVSDGVGAVTTTQTQEQGTIATSTNSLSVAISGNGFFDVSAADGEATAGKESFSDEQYYTRNGDFSEDKNGYLENTSGYYLDGYVVDPTTGVLDTSNLTQINVADIAFRPTETTTLTSTGSITPGTSGSTSLSSTIYDSQSDAHTLTTTWTEDTTASASAASGDTVYDVAISSSDSSMSVSSATSNYQVTFDSSGDLVSAVQGVAGSDGAVSYAGSSISTSGASADLGVTLTYTNGAAAQSIDINLGDIGSDAGTTTAAANSTDPTLTSDSVTTGTYEGIEMESDGSIMAEFSNGDTQLVGKISLSSFENADGLEAVDGQAYVSTSTSGSATTGEVGANGTGTLETSSTESSTTDLTSDLSDLIVTQEAYSANTKVVTTADTLLEDTISMIR